MTVRQQKTQKINNLDGSYDFNSLTKIINSNKAPKNIDNYQQGLFFEHSYQTSETSNQSSIIKIDLKSIIENPQILNNYFVKNFFNKFSLPCDTVSLKMIQFISEMQLNIDIRKLTKIHKLSQKFEKKEEACEIAMYLLEKGIEPTEETIKNVIYLLDNNNFDQKKDDSKKQKDFIKYLNHNNSSSKHWIILPFEYKIHNNEVFWGNIKILLDKDKKNLKKIAFFCKNSRKIHFLVLYFRGDGENKKSIDLYFCEDKPLSKADIKKQSFILNELLQNLSLIHIHYNPNLCNELFFADDTKISILCQEDV